MAVCESVNNLALHNKKMQKVKQSGNDKNNTMSGGPWSEQEKNYLEASGFIINALRDIKKDRGDFNLRKYLYIGCGGFTGAILRYLIISAMPRYLS